MSSDYPIQNSVLSRPGEVQKFLPDISAIEVDKKNIFRFLGMEPSDADDYTSDLVDKYIADCKAICKPDTSFILLSNPSFDLKDKTMILEEVKFSLGKLVTSFLRKSTYLAVFVGTCGAATESLSKQLMNEGNTLEGYIVDLIGSEMAEEIIEQLHDHLEIQANRAGYQVTNRYSPGYCNWPVSDQHHLFSLLKGETCGIELTPSSLMMPVKSVSGMLGIGREVKKVAYKCRYCDDKDCVLRGKS
jgi:hypothetical protein